jgi:hypothetical protein
LQAVRAKLLQQPDEAADKLVLVPEELSTIFTNIETELAGYLSLSFDPKRRLSDTRAFLLKQEGGTLEARGHCHQIVNV